VVTTELCIGEEYCSYSGQTEHQVQSLAGWGRFDYITPPPSFSKSMLALMPQLTLLRDAVEAMVKILVCDPASVVVVLTRAEGSAALHVYTSKRDLGVVIGKQGRTAKSLRALTNAASRRIQTVVSLDISEVKVTVLPAAA
jgi:predicted RNA-binding protein YlqC (UPF0109 family)